MVGRSPRDRRGRHGVPTLPFAHGVPTLPFAHGVWQLPHGGDAVGKEL